MTRIFPSGIITGIGCRLPNCDGFVHLDWSAVPLGVTISAVFVAKESEVAVPPNSKILPISSGVFCSGSIAELP